jgi:hypothetical protein
MMTLLLATLLLLQLDVPGRSYPNVPIEKLATWTRPRACVTATLVYKRKQADGDWHLTIAKFGAGVEHKVVVEVIPLLPMPIPKVGQVIKACGIVRIDKGHGGWPEIHPAEHIEVMR